jgi:hypothetical protein
MMGVLISISCNHTISRLCCLRREHYLTLGRRFNTQVSAWFAQNPILREQYGPHSILANSTVANKSL